MTVDDGTKEHLFDGVAGLRTYDVSKGRARRLRQRCHALLQLEPRPKKSAAMVTEALFRRVIGPALVGAWSLAYLVEIIRRAAAMYRLLP
jgi:hypothetical protein